MTSEYHKNWYLKNKQRHSEQTKARYVRNRETILARQRADRLANPEKYRARSRAYGHKYRTENRDTWLQAHKRRYWRATGRPEPTRPCPTACELCAQPPGAKSLCLDHDPITGNFRGWLCFKCNTALGKLGDTIEGIQRAIDYLTRSSASITVSDLC